MLVHWTPFREMNRLHADLDRFFETGFGPPRASAGTSREAAGTWQPAIDVHEDAEKIVMHADLPGVTEADLDIQVDKDVLTLRGTRKLEREELKEGERYRFERVAGAFTRSFTLPTTVDVEQISASMKEGVLTLTLPKRVEAQPRAIKVKVQ